MSQYLNILASKSQQRTGKVARRVLAAALLAGLVGAGAANAADDGSLTWNGITLYGVVDIGIGSSTHGQPSDQGWMVGLMPLVAKNSNKSVTGVASSGLSQSRIGLKGNEQIVDGLNFIFNLDSGFNPHSGQLGDALASLQHNNGKALQNQAAASDSSIAGQLFNRSAYFGLTSPVAGTITLGRQNSLLLDNIIAYDPQGGSFAFSVIGVSGLTAGVGDTEDTRLDNSIKYVYNFKGNGYGLHGGILYQGGKNDSQPGEAYQANIGGEVAGFTADVVYANKKDGISAASLSAAQYAVLPTDSLAASVSDNRSWTVDVSYAVPMPAEQKLRAFLGYERITMRNPSNPLVAPFNTIGGYMISVVNNEAYPNPRVVKVAWGGLKYSPLPALDIIGAAYHYNQNSYGLTYCGDASAATCAGQLWAGSLVADYHWTKRFDTYAGAMFSKVEDGLANGYLETNTLYTMIGFRFQF